jgi:hypothetical protein
MAIDLCTCHSGRPGFRGLGGSGVRLSHAAF